MTADLASEFFAGVDTSSTLYTEEPINLGV